MATYPVIKGGQTAIQMQPNDAFKASGVGGPAICEIDSYARSVNVGAHITYSAWFWTDSSTVGDTNRLSGAVLGLDLYGKSGRICEISTPDGQQTYPNFPTSHVNEVVHWGSGAWVKCTIDFVVQPQYMDETSGPNYGVSQTPTSFIPWVCGDSFSTAHDSEAATLYAYDIELSVS